MCRNTGLKFNAGNSKVIVFNEKGRFESEVHVEEIRLEHVSEFKYIWDVFWTNQVQIGHNAVGSEWEEDCMCYQVPG